MKCSMLLPQSLCNIDGKNYSLKNLFNQKAISNQDMLLSIFFSALYKKYPNQDSASHYGLPTGNNSLYDLFNEQVFKDHDLLKAMKDTSIVDFAAQTKLPIFIFTFKDDSDVTPLNYFKFLENGNSLITGYELDNNEITTNNLSWIPFSRHLDD